MPPENEVEQEKVQTPAPVKHDKIIFIKAPSPPEQQKVVIPPPKLEEPPVNVVAQPAPLELQITLINNPRKSIKNSDK